MNATAISDLPAEKRDPSIPTRLGLALSTSHLGEALTISNTMLPERNEIPPLHAVNPAALKFGLHPPGSISKRESFERRRDIRLEFR